MNKKLKIYFNTKLKIYLNKKLKIYLTFLAYLFKYL